MTTHDFVTVGQAAKELNLSVRAVQHRIKQGHIAATKLGDARTSAYIISRDELDRVKADTAGASAAAS